MKMTPWILALLLTGCGASDEPEPQEVMQASGEQSASDDDDSPTRDNDPSEVDDDPVDDAIDDPIVDPPDDPNTANLSDLYEPLFVASGCTAGYCHGGFGSADAVYSLVGTPAANPVCGRTQLVVPGEPENSVLWLRVRDTTPEDIECEVVKMPNGRTEPLDPELTQLVYDWIEQGAQR